jgi:hypothetical protein
MDNFDLKQFLIENKLTEVRLLPKNTGIANKHNGFNKFTPKDNIIIKWNNMPSYPQSMLTDMNTGDTFTKENFWETDIIGRDIHEFQPQYGIKDRKGIWTFSWIYDDGTEIKGFVELADFTF